MPRRDPFAADGTYHIGSRGTYGLTLFDTPAEHECFLRMYERVARKYDWVTPAWVLMKNHHHFVVCLTRGGLSEGLRELHGGYSRWIHAKFGQTRKGHLFRHGFFARPLEDDEALIGGCRYVDLNPLEHRPSPDPQANDWSGYAATVGLVHPRRFHTPSALLEVLDPVPSKAREKYRRLVEEEHARRRQVPSPNDVTEPQRD